MNKLLIFLIIPAVLSTTTSQPTSTTEQKDASIVYQFLTDFVNSARSNDYSIFAQNFASPIYYRNVTQEQIGEASQEALFQVIQEIPEDANIEQVFPRNKLNFVVYNDEGGPHLYFQKTEENVYIVFTVKLLSKNQFSLERVSFFSVTADTAGSIKKLI